VQLLLLLLRPAAYLSSSVAPFGYASFSALARVWSLGVVFVVARAINMGVAA
jgi:hypothetical protein